MRKAVVAVFVGLGLLAGCVERTSNFLYFCLNADTYFDFEITKRSRKRSRFMHQIRVTFCGLLPKSDGFTSLLPALTGPWWPLRRTAASSPHYRFSASQRRSAVVGKSRNFSKFRGSESGFWRPFSHCNTATYFPQILPATAILIFPAYDI